MVMLICAGFRRVIACDLQANNLILVSKDYILYSLYIRTMIFIGRIECFNYVMEC